MKAKFHKQRFSNWEYLYSAFLAASVSDPGIIKSVCDCIRSSDYDDILKAQLLDFYADQLSVIGINKDIYKFFNENEVNFNEG